MSDKQWKTEYDEQDTYQTGSTCPPKNHQGLIAFLLGLVIFLCGISTALGFMNVRLFRQLNNQTETTQAAVAFSRSGACMEDQDAVQTALGFSGEAITEFWHTYHGLPRGVFIQAVNSGSEAAAQGIIPGDILLRVNDMQVTSIQELRDALQPNQPGDPVDVVIYRQNRQFTLTLTLEDVS